MLENYRPPFNATVVEKLYNAGAIIMGKTNMDEFAMGAASTESYFGPTYHPWNSNLNFKYYFKNNLIQNSINSKYCDDKLMWYITGGSSGGSAISVSTGSSFVALSSDTGGSTRNPASRLGVVGFKPSYGLVSRFGLIPLTHSLDVPGIMARNVEDVLIVFSYLQCFDPLDPTTVNFAKKNEHLKDVNLRNVIIGIPDEYNCPGLHSNIANAWYQAQKMLSNYGVKIKPISLVHTKYSLPIYSILNTCEVASNFSCYDGIEYGYRNSNKDLNFQDCYCSSRDQALNDIVKSRIITGNYFLLNQNYKKYYEKALKIRRLITNDFYRAFKDVDFILTPVCRTLTMNHSEWNCLNCTEEAINEDFCTQPANMAGLPAISVPFKLDPINENLPIGIQIIGKLYDDYRLLKFSAKFEELANCPNLVLEM